MKKRIVVCLITAALSMGMAMGMAATLHAGVERAGEERPEDPGSQDSSLAVCGHLGEMIAARRALADGDRKEALMHLRAARALLVECERNAASEAMPRPERGRDLI